MTQEQVLRVVQASWAASKIKVEVRRVFDVARVNAARKPHMTASIPLHANPHPANGRDWLHGLLVVLKAVTG